MQASAPLTFQSEMAFGQDAELRIIARWAKKSRVAKPSHLLVRTPASATLDFLILTRQGVPAAWLEVKRRRTALSKYGDAICPWKKHLAAKKLHAQFDVPVLLVTEYGCGALIEVDLTTKPAERRDVSRRDRPSEKPVPHALYHLSQLTVLEEN